MPSVSLTHRVQPPLVGVILILLLAACAAPRSAGQTTEQSGAQPAPQKGRPNTLRIAFVEDVPQFSQRMGNGIHTLNGIVNAGLGQPDDHGVDHPMLLRSLPTPDDGSWIVNADGSMQTMLRRSLSQPIPTSCWASQKSTR